MIYKNKYIVVQGHYDFGGHATLRNYPITVAPLTLQNCRACIDAGLPTHDPLATYRYDLSPIQPYRHQRETATFLALNPRAFCWNEAGTGKTASCLWAIDYLFSQNIINSVLIVCPLSTTQAVWFKECLRLIPILHAEVLIGASDRRRKLFLKKYPIYITNHDGIKVLKDDMLKNPPDLIIVDESTAFKNARTDRWRTLNLLSKTAKYIWFLSGTPAPQAPTDLYAQGKIVCPEFAGKSFIRFRDKVMQQISQFKWVVKPDFERTLKDLIKPVIRFARDDCLDLPDIIYQTIETELSTKQAHAYNTLRRQAIVMINKNEITAVNEGVMRSKLLQCCGGQLYGTDEQGARSVVDLNPAPRLDATLDIVSECARGVLIFVPFISMLDNLNAFLTAQKITCKTISGETSLKLRTHYFNQFQNGEIKVLIAHPRTMGHGVTLTYADTVIWYVVSSDNELYEQANSRIHRIGQANKMRIIHLISTKLEAQILQRLQDKQTVQGVLLDTLGTAP